jgi:hypothetical protein
MAVRKCTEADADAVARVCVRGELAAQHTALISRDYRLNYVRHTTACADDPLLGDLLHPYRKEYPEDFLAYFQRRFLKKIGNPKSHHVVAVEVNDGQETITGYAEWVRRHAGDDNQMLSEAPLAGNKGSNAVCRGITNNPQTNP